MKFAAWRVEFLDPVYAFKVFTLFRQFCIGNDPRRQNAFDREIYQLEGWLYAMDSKFIFTFKEKKFKSQVMTFFDADLGIECCSCKVAPHYYDESKHTFFYASSLGDYKDYINHFNIQTHIQKFKRKQQKSYKNYCKKDQQIYRKVRKWLRKNQ